MMKVLPLLLGVVLLGACDSDAYGPDASAKGRIPNSDIRLIATGETWRDVCSMDTPDGLHNWRISDLLSEHRPFLVVFGTPQHCTMCVDQLVRAAALQEKYGNRFAVLHVDGYRDNAVWVEWGIKGEPWTFIVDSRGIVRKIFPGPTDVALMGQVIDEVLQETA